MEHLWTHEPMLSSAPEEVIKDISHLDGDVVFEAAVFRLENGKFLFISFSSDFRFDEGVGVTDMEEFDNLEDAVRLFNESVGEVDDQ